MTPSPVQTAQAPLDALQPAQRSLPFAPWQLSGLVVGALLNHRPELQALGDAANAPPHKGAPRAPVLQVKPRNTLCGPGSRIEVPASGVVLGVSLGLVLGRSACGLSVAEAAQAIAGCMLVCDVHLPLASHYRPAVHARARDGFCPLGPAVSAHGMNLDDLHTQVRINGELVFQGSTAERMRPCAQLLAEVSAFMTLSAGDVLLLGASHGSPTAHVGQQVSVGMEGVGEFAFELVAQGEGA